jgi:hypothetical protein
MVETSLRRAGLLAASEEFGGLASGGSESLVFFVVSPSGVEFVRKASGSGFSFAAWDTSRVGVMSDPYKRAREQVDYIQRLPPETADLFPRLYSVLDINLGGALGCHQALIADYEKVKGLSISDSVAVGEADAQTLPNLYRDVAQLLAEKVHTVDLALPASPSVEEFHLRKMEERIDLARRSWPAGTSNISPELQWIDINGRRYRSVWNCIDSIRNNPELLTALEPPLMSLVMGDCNTQNIILTQVPHRAGRRSHIRFIDPRGIGPTSEAGVVVDDPLYDWKYWHNSVGHYDLIYSGQFRLSVITAADKVPHVTIASAVNNAYGHAYNGIEASFEEVVSATAGSGQTLENRYGHTWRLRFLFLMGSHFSAMLPWHLRRNTTHDSVGATTLAMYCESVRWLNASLDYWNDELPFSNALAEFWLSLGSR